MKNQDSQELKKKNSTTLKLKICGMTQPENILEITALQPDYMGFIFHEKSPRNFDNVIPHLPASIKKTGVFVDATLSFIQEKVKKHHFEAVQLHGEETPELCEQLNLALKNTVEQEIEIIKVFSVKEKFDFALLEKYEGKVDYFLFDTKGKNKGGNGYTFNWELLKGYPSTTPFFLSGGIGMEEVGALDSLISYFKKTGKQELLFAIDVNSKFETSPGVKSREVLEKFQCQLKTLP